MGRAGRTARLALAALALLLLAPGALAHAELAASEPAVGERLDAAPARVQVTLTEPVDPDLTSLRVLDAQDRAWDLGDLRFTPGPNPTISVGLSPDTPDGTYRMVWLTTSRTDGHTTNGAVGFAIGDFAAGASSSPPGVRIDSAVARFIAYAGFSLAFGAAAFLLWMAPVGVPTLPARVALLAGATLQAAGALLLAAHTATAQQLDLVQLRSSEVGFVLLLRCGLSVAAWLLALVWTFRPVIGGTAVVTGLLLGAALGSARLGHPYTHGTMGLDFVHLVSAATWVGGLALFAHYVWGARDGAGEAHLREAGLRFGTLALVAVVTLALSGLIISVSVLGAEQLADPLRVLSSPYGAFLAAKVALAAAMVALAAVNRYVLLEPPAESGLAGTLQRAAGRATRGRLAPSGSRSLRRTVALEAALGVAVLLLAGLLTSAPPPTLAEPARTTVESDALHHRITLESPPPRVGEPLDLRLRIVSLDAGEGAVVGNTCGRTAPASCVVVHIAYNGTAPEEHRAVPDGDSWAVTDGVWLRPGEATLRIVVSTATHYEDEAELRLTVAG